jgi:hypothetical protein
MPGAATTAAVQGWLSSGEECGVAAADDGLP